jgi:hypothetical protein
MSNASTDPMGEQYRLRKCPYCRNRSAKLVESTSKPAGAAFLRGTAQVICSVCGARGPIAKNRGMPSTARSEAIEGWEIKDFVPGHRVNGISYINKALFNLVMLVTILSFFQFDGQYTKGLGLALVAMMVFGFILGLVDAYQTYQAKKALHVDEEMELDDIIRNK